jgi:hypothetical protein
MYYVSSINSIPQADELLALSLEMTELNGSGGSYLLDERTINLHILKSVYIFCFEPNLVLRNSVRFSIGALVDIPNRDPQRRTDS